MRPSRPLSRFTERKRSASLMPRSFAGLYCHSSIAGVCRLGSGSTVAQNSASLVQTDSAKIDVIMEHSWRSKQKAVKAIEQPTVSRERRRPVFNAQVALD